MEDKMTFQQVAGAWTLSFFDELARCGVRAVVVSPGSRSTPLAMAAYELSCRRPADLRVHVDVDERGAAFFGLGLAKATGRPVALVCTSGTATANYYPAVIEAETSRVPLVVLTGDRPPRLQGLGAPQTTDQLKLYGDHVRAFRSMPLPGADAGSLAFARQAAREAVLAASGGAPVPDGQGAPEAAAAGVRADAAAQDARGSAGEGELADGVQDDLQVASRACERMAGPVHLNFPFDEPLKPDFSRVPNIAPEGGEGGFPRNGGFLIASRATIGPVEASRIAGKLAEGGALVLAGEGSCSTLGEARELVSWARRFGLPLLADPLSGLRSVDDPCVIDSYDAVFGRDDCPLPRTVIRFGRYPVSKRATTRLAAARPFNIVVDAGETRDYNAATDWFVPASPLDFVRSLSAAAASGGVEAGQEQRGFLRTWQERSAQARSRIAAEVGEAAGWEGELFEGSVIDAVMRLADPGSCVFAANSMAVRNIDTFYARCGKPLCVLANRGQNGIDGTVSSALGAAQAFRRTTLVTGDLTLLHDLNALALQREFALQRAACGAGGGDPARTAVIVLLNNDGGAIFDMLPQASDQPYFPRLFLTPQEVDFSHAAQAFGVPYRRSRTVAQFERQYRECLQIPGISLIEVRTPLRGLKERLGGCWR